MAEILPPNSPWPLAPCPLSQALVPERPRHCLFRPSRVRRHRRNFVLPLPSGLTIFQHRDCKAYPAFRRIRLCTSRSPTLHPSPWKISTMSTSMRPCWVFMDSTNCIHPGLATSLARSAPTRNSTMARRPQTPTSRTRNPRSRRRCMTSSSWRLMMRDLQTR